MGDGSIYQNLERTPRKRCIWPLPAESFEGTHQSYNLLLKLADGSSIEKVSKAVQNVFLALDTIQFHGGIVYICDLYQRYKLSDKFWVAGKIFPEINHTVF